MPRPKRAARERRATITDAERRWAYGLEALEGKALFKYTTTSERFRAVWAELQDEVLEAWIAERPGTRPPLWWVYSAPRRADPSGTFRRRRLGGTGTPTHEALATVLPSYERGIPAIWIQTWEVAYYNGRAVNVDGEPIGTEFAEGHFPHVAIDPADPPVFESEATYLDRHGSLTDAERAHLDDNGWPEPERVV